MTRLLRFIVGFLYFIQQHFSFRAFFRQGRFILLSLTNADQANQDLNQRLGGMLAPGLELSHYNIGKLEVNNKLNTLLSRLPGFSSQGLELAMDEVQLLVRRRKPVDCSNTPALASTAVAARPDDSSVEQKPSDWLGWLRKLPELIKRIDVQRFHVCYEDETDSDKPMLAGLAFEQLLLDGEQRSIDLKSLSMHLSPPLSRVQQSEDIRSVMSEIFTSRNLKFHSVLQPLTMGLRVNLPEPPSRHRAILQITMQSFNFDMTSRQYELLSGQVDKLNQLFRQDFRQATSSARNADLEAAANNVHQRSSVGDGSVGSTANFDAKVKLDFDEIGFTLREGRSPILIVALGRIDAALERVNMKHSMTASLMSLSVIGSDGRQLVKTEACICRPSEEPAQPSQAQANESVFVRLVRSPNSPHCLEIGACHIVHCVSTATCLSKFFRVPSVHPAEDDQEPELDEDLLNTLRFLTRRRRGRNGTKNGGANLRFRGHLDGLSFRLPTGPIQASNELVCQLDEVELKWLLTASRDAAGSNLIADHLTQLGLKEPPRSIHQLKFRWEVFVPNRDAAGAGGRRGCTLVQSRTECAFGVNAAMDLPKLSLVLQTSPGLHFYLSPESLATLAGAAKWSGPSLSRLLGIPTALPSFAAKQQQQQPNHVQSPLQWQAYIKIDDLSVTMATTELKAQIGKLRFNAVKQPNWLEARLIVDFLLLEDKAFQKPLTARASPIQNASSCLRLLSSQLDVIEFADGVEVADSGSTRRRALKRVPYAIAEENHKFMSVLIQLSPERLTATGQIDSLSLCLQPLCLAGCLSLVEDICRRLSDLPLPLPLHLTTGTAAGQGTGSQHPEIVSPPEAHRRLQLELRLNDTRVDLASLGNQFICACSLTEFNIEASSSYETGCLKRALEFTCTGLKVDAGRSGVVDGPEKRRLFAMPLLADLPHEPVAKLGIVSWPGSFSRLEIHCVLNKIQLVLLPELAVELQSFAASIQKPLLELQSRLNWQAGDILQSAETELRQAGGLKVQASILAPRLILPLTFRSESDNTAAWIDLGSFTVSNGEADGETQVDFNDFVKQRPALNGLLPANAVKVASPSDRLLLRLEGLSASVCRLRCDSSTGFLVAKPIAASANFGDGQGDAAARSTTQFVGGMLRFDGESADRLPVLTAQLARRRCVPSSALGIGEGERDGDGDGDGEDGQQAWLAVAMETPGLILRATPSDLRSLASLMPLLAKLNGDAVDGDKSSPLTRAGWAYEFSVKGFAFGAALRRQRPATVWQLRLAGASIDALDVRGEGDGDSSRSLSARWSLFNRAQAADAESSRQPGDLLLIRSLSRSSLTFSLAPSQISLWPDDLPLIRDCLKLSNNQSEASVQQRSSTQPPLAIVLSGLTLSMFCESRQQLAKLGGQRFQLHLGGFNGSTSEAKLTSARLTFSAGDDQQDLELLQADSIGYSQAASMLIFDSQLQIRLSASALSSAVDIGNAWQPLLGGSSITATESTVQVLEESFTISANRVSLALLESSSDAGFLQCSVDKLTASLKSSSKSCSIVLAEPAASVSVSCAGRAIDEPLLTLEHPLSEVTNSSLPQPELQLSANFSTGSLGLACLQHRVCLAVSPAAAGLIGQLIDEFRRAAVGGGHSVGSTNTGSRAGHSSENGIGNGGDIGPGSGPGNGPGTGKGQGSIPGNGSGSGPGNGSGSGPGNGSGSGPGSGSGSGPGSGSGSGPGSGSGSGPGNVPGSFPRNLPGSAPGSGSGSANWQFQFDLHSVSLLLLEAAGAVCPRCGSSACRSLANLSVDSVGPLWLKSSVGGPNSKKRQLKPRAADAVEKLRQRWLLAQRQSTLSNSAVVELHDGDWSVRFDAAGGATTLLRPKRRQLERHSLAGVAGVIELLGSDSAPLLRLRLRLGRLQLDQLCPGTPDSLSVPVSLRARSTRDVLKDGRLSGAEIEVKLRLGADAANGTGSDETAGLETAADRVQQQQPSPTPLHFPELSLSLGRLDLAYDAAFIDRLLATLAPQTGAPPRRIRIDRLALQRDLKLRASNVPLIGGSAGAGTDAVGGWRYRVTLPAGVADGVDWPSTTGGDAQQWAKREIWRLVRHRPGMAVTLPAGCVIGPCSSRTYSQPMPLTAWMSMVTVPGSASSQTAVGDVSDFSDGRDRAIALLDGFGQSGPTEELVLSDWPRLLLTNLRLLELGIGTAGCQIVVRQFRLAELSVEATPGGFRLEPGGETFSAGAQFARKLVELSMPEADTAL